MKVNFQTMFKMEKAFSMFSTQKDFIKGNGRMENLKDMEKPSTRMELSMLDYFTKEKNTEWAFWLLSMEPFIKALLLWIWCTDMVHWHRLKEDRYQASGNKANTKSWSRNELRELFQSTNYLYDFTYLLIKSFITKIKL